MGMRKYQGVWTLEQDSKKIHLEELCLREGQPFYLYDLDGILSRLKVFRESFSGLQNKLSIHYAMKANSNRHIIRAFHRMGVGLDVVSGGEIRHGLNCGFKGGDMVFSGVGKTISEIELALKENVKQINVESVEELKRIADLAHRLGLKAPIALRLNPDVNPQTHPYIRTGFKENKFGVDSHLLPEVRRILKDNKSTLNLKGLTIHVGSQIRNIAPIIDAIETVKTIYFDFCERGYNLTTMDIGGGLGINYHGEGEDMESDLALIKEYGEKVSEIFDDWSCEVLCEPGRVLVGPFGFLFGEVQYVKRTPYKNFIILNTGMHHLMRPCLYQAHHRIEKLRAVEKERRPICELYDIVGPICESSDVLGFDRYLSEISQGDYMMICDVGAYGFSMANNYNHHDLPRELVYSCGQCLTD